MALALYRGATTAAAPAIRGYLRRRARNGKEDPDRMAERFGVASTPRPEGPLVWIHAASVGESRSMLSVIERLRAERPAVTILMTTGTVSSARMLTDLLPAGVIHQFVPVDRVAWVRRFLDHWRPDLALWVESEFWPNLLVEADARNVPLVLLNARMSARSYRGWERFSGVIANLLNRFDLCMAQSEETAERLRALGAAHVDCPGNLKFAAAPLPYDAGELAKMSAEIGDRPVWLAASTHPGEEELIADAHHRLAERRQNLLTVVVPRHAGRGPEIAEMLAARGRRAALRVPAARTLPATPRSTSPTAWASSACSFACAGSRSSAARCCRTEGTTRWSRHVWAAPSCTDRIWRTSRRLPPSSRAPTPASPSQILTTSPGRSRRSWTTLRCSNGAARPGSRVVEQKSQVLDSVFTALAPYLDPLGEETRKVAHHARA